MADARLVLLTPEQVIEHWDAMLPFVSKGVAENQGEYDETDIFLRLESGEWFAWLAYKDELVCVAISGEVEFPKYKIHQLICVGGSDMLSWLPLKKEIEDFAKQNGCRKLTSYGRVGWSRILCNYGFKETYRVMEKVL